MAGSYNHVTTSKGKLRSYQGVFDMLDHNGDVYEAIEQMYGMIWWLAEEISVESPNPLPPAEYVERARKEYIEGLMCSPGVKA